MQQDENKFIEDYLAGKIQQGKDVGLTELDYHIRYKQGQLVIINGLDNVGKTIWVLWYYLCLANKHGLKFTIYSGENDPNDLKLYLWEFYLGKKLENVDRDKIYNAQAFVQEHFTFLNSKKFYKLEDLLADFQSSDCNAALIDPFTGLDRGYTHADNYDFLNQCRNFVNTSNITLYINTHVVSNASRAVHTENDGSEIRQAGLVGYPKPPSKSQSEGGQPFANRADDFITIHRYAGHPELGNKTLFFTRKVKSTRTGGHVSDIRRPIYFDWNYGCGFTEYGMNPITGQKQVQTDKAPF